MTHRPAVNIGCSSKRISGCHTIISCKSVGNRAYNTISSQHFVGAVHSVFDTSVNVITKGNDLIAIVSKNLRSALTVAVDLPVSFREIGITENMRVIRIGNSLTIPEACIQFTLAGAEIWTMPVMPKQESCCAKNVMDNLRTVIGICSMFDMQNSLGEILLALDLGLSRFSVREKKLNEMAEIALPHILRFMKGIRYMRFHELVNGASFLVGLGPGSTPSGDDFLASLMASMWLATNYLRADDAFLKEASSQILAQVKGRTNLLGEILIEYAAKGEVTEPVFNLVKAILLSENTLMERTVNVLRIGAYSGKDSLLGIVMGIYESLLLSKRTSPFPA